jgi:pimeloyl-ACP methyl ester carboxylesterase
MNKTIIFISGFGVPQVVAQSRFLWDKPFWSDYKCIWQSSRTPTSDGMVERELNRLQRLLGRYPDATLAGHSLGGWWAANLALRSNVTINKMVLWTPLCNAGVYPIFKVSARYHPLTQEIAGNFGRNHVLTFVAKDDVIVPPYSHGTKLSAHFLSGFFKLDGGHFYQANHKLALYYMKHWIEE